MCAKHVTSSVFVGERVYFGHHEHDPDRPGQGMGQGANPCESVAEAPDDEFRAAAARQRGPRARKSASKMAEIRLLSGISGIDLRRRVRPSGAIIQTPANSQARGGAASRRAWPNHGAEG